MSIHLQVRLTLKTVCGQVVYASGQVTMVAQHQRSQVPEALIHLQNPCASGPYILTGVNVHCVMLAGHYARDQYSQAALNWPLSRIQVSGKTIDLHQFDWRLSERRVVDGVLTNGIVLRTDRAFCLVVSFQKDALSEASYVTECWLV